MDEYQLEMAEHLAEVQRLAAVDAAARSVAPEQHPGFNGTDCVECDTEIPAARLAMGRVRCVSCQTRLEAQKGRR